MRSIGVRWIVGTLIVAAIVSGCIAAGFWQLRRLDERRATNAQVRARSTTTIPMPAQGFAADASEEALVFHRVRVAGTYDASHEFLLRFRSRKGLPGYEVVTPLVTGAGAVLVNRGWVPLDEGDRWPVASAAPPAGEVEVEGVLVPREGADVRLTAPAGAGKPAIAGAVDPARLRVALPYDDVYALPLLAAGSSSAFPAPVDPPSLGEGPHRDYAVQWFLFASVGIVGWPLLLRRRGPWARRTTGPEPTLPS